MSEDNVLKRYARWCSSYTGSMIWAILSFLCLLSDIWTKQYGLATFMGICTLYWLWLAHRATKKAEVKAELTPEQEAKLQEAIKNFADAMKEIELDIKRTERQKEAESVGTNDKEGV